MILTKNIKFKDFKFKSSSKKIKNFFAKLLESEIEIIRSLNKSYRDSYLKKDLKKFNKYSDVVLIGMGGSILGARSIYNFLKHKIKKNFFFIFNFEINKNNKINKIPSKKKLNIIISKSGNTLEKIVN